MEKSESREDRAYSGRGKRGAFRLRVRLRGVKPNGKCFEAGQYGSAERQVIISGPGEMYPK
jgi:hypothetical protein